MSLCSRIKYYLTVGSEGDTAPVIKSSVEEFIHAWKLELSNRRAFSDSLKRELSYISNMKNAYEDTKIFTILRKHKRAQLEYQLILLGQKVNVLSNLKNVEEYPALLVDLMHSIPKYIGSDSRIILRVKECAQDLRKRFLFEFHEDFENHMKDIALISESKDVWTNFFSRSRNGLLTFFLVSILPTILSNDLSIVHEKFKESLDAALTPLWGRFHFHLSSAREEGSEEQLLWTFEYSKSFINMIVTLCLQISSTGLLNELHPTDYEAASKAQVAEKATKFIRAHCAQIIFTLPPKSQFSLKLIENALALDHEIAQIAKSPSTTICSIFADAKLLFAEWASNDFQYFLSNFEKAFTSNEYAFSMKFPKGATSLINFGDLCTGNMVSYIYRAYHHIRTFT